MNYKIVYQVDGGNQIIVEAHKPAHHQNSNQAPFVKSVKSY